MRIGVLTSSRADYSIYLPLLKAIQNDPSFDLAIIAFGTHLSEEFGKTINQIFQDGFEVSFRIETLVPGNDPISISRSMGKTISAFAELWDKEKFDIVFCLGDRYEMFAACAAGVPFNVRFAHIHGGEETLGAIDDVFRHSISLMASVHFASTEVYAKRISELKHASYQIYNVGALSIDNLKNLFLFSVQEFQSKFGIDLSIPSILITFHPETVSFEKNEEYIDILLSALNEIHGYQFIITMPNADTMGNMVRGKLSSYITDQSHAIGVESFGTIGYLSCMKYCSFLLGNTSSGFIEASFFPKYVINLGQRQKGRIVTPNIKNIEINKKEILDAVNNFKQTIFPEYEGIYGNGKAAEKIISILKNL